MAGRALSKSEVTALTEELRKAPFRANGLLTTADAAAYLGREPKTLSNWRSAGEGPRFSGSGRGVRYRLADLDAWVKANTRTGTR